MKIQTGGVHSRLENPRICPYLGLADDERTALAFPSDWNDCHHCKPLSSIKLDHQRTYCLSPNYRSCTAYQQPPEQALPRDLRNRGPVRPWLGKPVWTILLTLLILVLIGAVVLNYLPAVGPFSLPGSLEIPGLPGATQTPSPPPVSPSPERVGSPTAAMLPSGGLPTHLPTLSAEASTPSVLPSAQPTATITRIPQELETLIGLNYLFKIHRVRQGESLDLLAYANGTTVAALFAVNDHLSTPLHPQQMIIIPVNQSDVSGLPPFEPYRVVEDTSLAALAAELGADAAQIQFYNGLGNSDQFHAGEWILVPRPAGGAE